MKLLLTSSGITNTSIHDALLGLLGKPIEASSALVIPTAIYPFPGGAGHAWEAICGRSKSPFAGLGWKSVGVLELSVLPSIDEECWVPAVQEADALLVWGGDPVFLAYWMRRSGLADVLPSLSSETVYLGVSAGSIAATSAFAETYREPRRGSGDVLSTEDIVFDTPDGEVRMILVKAQGVGLVDFAIIPHVDSADPEDMAIAEQWAARIPAPTYAIDDQTAIKVTDGKADVVSEGRWRLFTP
ncbi:MAG TPA: Type 1 glutamine amidotransferase-like domain-containing protein [Streptosporangiaceae bacterium]|nr:Type 1 glutamine amidotransferase-like domain-containing protein [Streptosporangiaceae bacterium]